MIITFITTVDHNVGDDFVREGIKYLLRQVFKGKELSFQNIHKHSPITVRHGFEFFKNIKISKFSFPSKNLDALLPLRITKDKILEADIVIQSGAPVYWCHKDFGSHCADNEWYDPLIRRRFKENHDAILLNIAAGSCQGYNSDGSEFQECIKDIEYIREFYDTADLTTVRDNLAKKILDSLNFNPSLIPCPSIYAIDEYGLKPSEGQYLVINYMQIGGHYTFGKKIESAKWNKVLKEFYEYVKNKEDILFVCHNKNEVENAKKIDNTARTFFSNNFLDYMKIYNKAKYGIMNRIHGAFIMASYGAPSFVIGNDSRAKMTEEIGLESMFLNDITFSTLVDKYESLKKIRKNYIEVFNERKKVAYDKYVNLLSNVLNKYCQ